MTNGLMLQQEAVSVEEPPGPDTPPSGYAAIDEPGVGRLARKLWAALPLFARRRDRDLLWRQCVGLATATRRRGDDPSPRAVAEDSYRRGVVQGTAYAVEAIRRGATADDLYAHVYGELWDWRGEDHHGDKECPPIWWPEEEGWE